MKITESKLRKIIRKTILETSQLHSFDIPKQTPKERQLQDNKDFLTQQFYSLLDSQFDHADNEYYGSKYDHLEDYYNQIGYQLASIEMEAQRLKAAQNKHAKIKAIINIYYDLRGIDSIESELEQGDIANSIFNDVPAGDTTRTSSAGYELAGYIEEAVDRMVMSLTGMSSDRIRQIAQKIESIQM